MDYSTIRYGVVDGIATITLNRPAKLNAFTVQMMTELVEVCDRVDNDGSVRAVIVTGEGTAFCAGADLTPEDGGGPFSSDETVADLSDSRVRDAGGMVTLRLFRCTKPIIGAINGAAVGIGATMQLPMDIRLASTSARFGFVFARRGMVPEAASGWFLPRLVGYQQALEWCMTGRVFGAQEALAGGLVRSLHAPEDLIPAATALAREIADHAAPVSVALTRAMLWRLPSAPHPMHAHRIDSRAIYTRSRSGDAAEGVSSFLQKRPASFSDRIATDMPSFYPWWDEPSYE